MKKYSIIFLQIVIVLLGLGVLALLLWEPHLEGVNAQAAFFEVYLDPFIMLVYAGSVPFFLALYRAFQLLGYARQDQFFSHAAVKALRTIKYCALAVIAFVAAEEIYIILTHGNDDAAGGIAMGVIIALVSVIVAAGAAVFERQAQQAADIKSEHELTV